jgi:flagellar assembly protein FliH
LSSCAVMKKMDLYKANVIKANEVIDSGRPVSLFHSFPDGEKTSADLSPIPEQTRQEKLRAATELRLSQVSDESYRKGFAEGVEFQKKEISPVLDAISTMTRTIPLIRKNIIAKTEEQIVKLSLAIAEKVINQEVATSKEIILGVLKGVLKNISETEGMKIRLNPQDFRHIMEVKKDFLQSIDGVRNVVFEEDISIKRGGAVVETMFGEVDARLESQIKEIKEAMLKL